MAKTAVAVRLDPGLLEWVDGYARDRGVSRQVVLEGAISALRGVAAGGVPDLEPPAVLDAVAPDPGSGVGKASRPVRALPPGVKTASELARERMHKMNPERYG